jgi:hypothetical protein
MEKRIKENLNKLFSLTEKLIKEKDEGMKQFYANNLAALSRPVPTVEEAISMWMLVEIESYLTLLTNRKCTHVKVWKPVGVWTDFDVYFEIEAQGRSTRTFGLKTYVLFQEGEEFCEFKLEDWADGTQGYVVGEIKTTYGGNFTCQRKTRTAPRDLTSPYRQWWWEDKIET